MHMSMGLRHVILLVETVMRAVQHRVTRLVGRADAP